MSATAPEIGTTALELDPGAPVRDVLAERAAVEALVAGRTLPLALLATATTRGGDPAYSDKVGVPAGEPGWRTLTWAQVREQALTVAAGMVEAGLAPGDTVAIMATSRTEHVTADLGAVHAGGTPMSVYATLAPEQVAYVAATARPSVVVLEGTDQLDRWRQALAACDSIRAVVVLEPDAVDDTLAADPRVRTWADLLAAGAAYRSGREGELDARWQGLDPEQPLTILFTSGTTGNPKGVVLTHHNLLFESVGSLVNGGLVGEDAAHAETLSYLPFAHIAERILGMYNPQVTGIHVHLLHDPALLVAALAEVRPTRFFGVPRVWEKIKTGVSARLAAEPDEARRAAVEGAMAVGLEYVEALQYGSSPSPELTARFEAVDGAVLSTLRGLLGLDRVAWAASAAAPMPVEVARFFAGLGIRIYDVYGMTETGAAVTACGPAAFRLGTVGRALPGIEIAIAEDGEILARGPVTTPGYLDNPEATAALLDADGWVHTGDIGELDADGFLRVVDRKKEMIITSSGKNIAPSTVENLLKESPLVGHALVYGEGKPYVVAILTLDAEIAPLVAQRHGIAYDDLADLATKPEILAMVQAGVDAANARVSRPEQVKSFELLPVEWTAESEELTPTLKLKRRVVHTKYSDVLDRLYR